MSVRAKTIIILLFVVGGIFLAACGGAIPFKATAIPTSPTETPIPIPDTTATAYAKMEATAQALIQDFTKVRSRMDMIEIEMVRDRNFANEEEFFQLAAQYRVILLTAAAYQDNVTYECVKTQADGLYNAYITHPTAIRDVLKRLDEGSITLDQARTEIDNLTTAINQILANLAACKV